MKNLFQYVIAFIVIAIGTVLIIENLGIATFNMQNAWLYLYPVLFIVFGMKWMIDRMRGIGGSWVAGSFFFIFGSLLILDRFEVIEFVFKDIYKLWPLFIIYIGFAIISHSRKKNKFYVIYKESKKDKGNNGSNSTTWNHFDADSTQDSSEEKTKGKKKHGNSNKNSSMFSIGNHEFNSPNWKVEPMYLNNLVGDFYLDFTKAYIPEEHIPITVSALAGDIHILIPENVEFRAIASVKAGEVKIDSQSLDGINRSLSYESSDFEAAKKSLDLTLSLTAGSIRVDRV